MRRAYSLEGIVLVLIWLSITALWWAFAFWPTPDMSHWIARSQAVCFGKTPNGLPEIQGWILLIGAPLLFLISLGTVYREDFSLKNLKLLWEHSLWKVVTLLFVLLTLIEAGWIISKIKVARTVESSFLITQSEKIKDLPEHYPVLNQKIQDFLLLDQKGQTFLSKNLIKKPTILTFVFAHCSSVCPGLVVRTLKVLKSLPQDRVQAVFITLDPWRDTPSALPSLAKNWNLTSQNVYLLSASNPKDVIQVLDQFSVPRKRNERTGEIEHPALMYVLNSKGEISYAFNDPSERWLIQAIERL